MTGPSIPICVACLSVLCTVGLIGVSKATPTMMLMLHPLDELPGQMLVMHIGLLGVATCACAGAGAGAGAGVGAEAIDGSVAGDGDGAGDVSGASVVVGEFIGFSVLMVVLVNR